VIISYINKETFEKNRTRSVKETRMRMENKKQLQDILKSMANLLNQGPDSFLSYPSPDLSRRCNN